jgi:thiosulfate dehydrogenase [quinone] large subunit
MNLVRRSDDAQANPRKTQRASYLLHVFFAAASKQRARLAPKSRKGTAMNGRLPLIGLLLVQIAVGYEWLVSGVAKVVRGGFPAGLADELRDKSKGAASWYRSWLDGSVIPYGRAWGYAIMLSEIAVGVVLIGVAVTLLVGRERIGDRTRQHLLMGIVLASLAAVFMAVNFHLANGASHPWLIPRDGFDEGIDLDSLLPMIQIATAAVAARAWLDLRRERATAVEKVDGSHQLTAAG